MTDKRLGFLRLVERVDALEPTDDPLRPGGGGGRSGDVTDDWKESVDRQLGQLHADVRALLRWGVAAVVALAALIGGLYVRSDSKFEALDQRVTAIQVEQAKMTAKLDLLVERTAPEKK